MENVPGFDDVRYDPSRIRPRTVVADVDVELFLGGAFPRQTATVEVVHEPGRIDAEAPLPFLELCLDRLPERLRATAES